MTGKTMLEIRNELGLTQAQLSKLIGGKATLISDYENNRRNIPNKLAIVMECFREISRLGGNIEAVANRANHGTNR